MVKVDIFCWELINFKNFKNFFDNNFFGVIYKSLIFFRIIFVVCLWVLVKFKVLFKNVVVILLFFKDFIWFCIKEMRGEIIIVKFGLSNVGIWKYKDFFLLVGMIINRFFCCSVVWIICFCLGWNEL